MRNPFRLIVTTALATALAACGSDAEEAAGGEGDLAATSGEVPAGAASTGEDGAAEAPEAGETPATEAPGPTSAVTPNPAPAPGVAAAPAGPPASFATCAVCHSTQRGQNGVGPSLAGVLGRRAGSVGGANYSPAMQAANLTWTEANLRRYLADPAGVVPGTMMPPPGLAPAQMTEVVNYLKTL